MEGNYSLQCYLKKPNFLMGADKHNVHMFNNPHAKYLNEGLSTGV